MCFNYNTRMFNIYFFNIVICNNLFFLMGYDRSMVLILYMLCLFDVLYFFNMLGMSYCFYFLFLMMHLFFIWITLVIIIVWFIVHFNLFYYFFLKVLMFNFFLVLMGLWHKWNLFGVNIMILIALFLSLNCLLNWFLLNRLNTILQIVNIFTTTTDETSFGMWGLLQTTISSIWWNLWRNFKYSLLIISSFSFGWGVNEMAFMVLGKFANSLWTFNRFWVFYRVCLNFRVSTIPFILIFLLL